jgi:hypothetical protein
LTGSRRWRLLQRALELGLGHLNLRLLSDAIRGERIVVNGNQRVVIELRLIVYRHQGVIRCDDEDMPVFCPTCRIVWRGRCAVRR